MQSFANTILYQDVDDVARLIRGGADVNKIDEYGYTPLTEAALANKTETAALLLSNGAKINQPDLTGNSPLQWAVENSNAELCKLFLQQGGDPNNYNLASQPLLTMPILREQSEIKNLLYHHGADAEFALDFINAKLIGHRFELKRKIDIVNSEGNYITINLEGFFLESTIRIVLDSLTRFQNNYAARHLRHFSYYIQKAIDSLTIAAELIQYQQFNVDIESYAEKIDRLLDFPILILPLSFHGHAINFIKLNHWLAKCDRGEASLLSDSIILYNINNPQQLNKEHMKKLLYQKLPENFISDLLPQALQLNPISQLSLPSQVVGNCTWANVEACIPTIMFMVSLYHQPKADTGDIIRFKNNALTIYEEWREWDKDRALDELVSSFYKAQPARQAAKASLLASIVVQSLKAYNHRDIERAKKIFPILTQHDYDYILRAYLNAYSVNRPTKLGKNLIKLMQLCQVSFAKPID